MCNIRVFIHVQLTQLNTSIGHILFRLFFRFLASLYHHHCYRFKYSISYKYRLIICSVTWRFDGKFRIQGEDRAGTHVQMLCVVEQDFPWKKMQRKKSDFALTWGKGSKRRRRRRRLNRESNNGPSVFHDNYFPLRICCIRMVHVYADRRSTGNSCHALCLPSFSVSPSICLPISSSFIIGIRTIPSRADSFHYLRAT